MDNTFNKAPFSSSIDEGEREKFQALAASWWDENGPFKPLHRFNPVRLGYIRDMACDWFKRDKRSREALKGLSVLDIGCGGGLLAEPLARMGATVLGIDIGEKNVKTAAAHAEGQNLPLTYRAITAEALAEESRHYDIVLTMEVVEHVADVDGFLATCAGLVKPGGLLFVATLNRTPKSYAFAVLGAEYILRWLPRGTHDWKKFLRPSEVEAPLRTQGMVLKALSGVTYNPLKGNFSLSKDTAVNYMMVLEKPER